MLASAYTAKYPDHVNLLLLIGSGEINVDITPDVTNNIIRHMQPSDFAVFKFWGDSINAKQNPEQAAYMLRKYWVKQLVFDTSKLDNVMNQVQGGKMNNTMSNLMWQDLINTKMNLITELNKYSGSALVIFGWEDPVGVTTLSQYIKAFPHALFEGIHNCGHYCGIEQPTIFYSIVNTFLEKHLK